MSSAGALRSGEHKTQVDGEVNKKTIATCCDMLRHVGVTIAVKSALKDLAKDCTAAVRTVATNDMEVDGPLQTERGPILNLIWPLSCAT
jgi:hypothetical protein